MSELIRVTRSGVIANVTLNRPDVHNAFNAELIAAIHETCINLARESSLRAVILQGAGPSFCAGADINWMRESLEYSHEENIADATQLDAMLETLNTLPLAVVGRVHGMALGGGVGLLACCDIVVAASGTRFGFTEVRLGLLPAVIARYVIPRIGAGHARALFVSGQRFDANRAHAIGLVHEVVPELKLDAAVQRVMSELLRCGPQAIVAAKSLVRSITTLSPEEARNYAIEAIAVTRTGAEGQEGLRAFLEKRMPSWCG